MQPARGHKSVAAVIPLAAENYDPCSRSMVRENIVGHSRARVLHQRERRHAKSLAGSAINASHLLCGNDFHKSSGQCSVASGQWPVKHFLPDYKTKRPSAPCGGPIELTESNVLSRSY